MKLNLPESGADHRRVLAVITFLKRVDLRTRPRVARGVSTTTGPGTVLELQQKRITQAKNNIQ